MPNEPIIDELSPLLEALCEERLTPDEVVHLERLVLASPEARWRYLTYVDLHGSLYWNAAGIGSPTALSSEEIPVWAGAVVPVPEPVSIPSRRQHHWLLRQSRAFAALTILAFFGIGWFLNSVLSSKPGGGNLARNSAPSERVTTPNRNHPVSVEKNAPRPTDRLGFKASRPQDRACDFATADCDDSNSNSSGTSRAGSTGTRLA
jgi:hypothetical protein